MSLANHIHDAIQAVRGKNYTVEQFFELYATSGGGEDYAYRRNFTSPPEGRLYAFTIEWGTEFQLHWEETEKIIIDISSGLVEVCIKASELDFVIRTPNTEPSRCPAGPSDIHERHGESKSIPGEFIIMSSESITRHGCLVPITIMVPK